MSHAHAFNDLAGKVVAVEEFQAKLAQNGIRNIDLAADVVPQLYVSQKAAAELCRQVTAALNGKEIESADPAPGSIFVEILPLLTAIGDQSENMVEGFAAAARDCADHRSRIGHDLLGLQEAFDAITDMDFAGIPNNYLPPSATKHWQPQVRTSAGLTPGHWHQPVDAPWVYK